MLAPAERADLIVDFSLARGENVILHSDELDLMQFRVGKTTVADDSHLPNPCGPSRAFLSRALRALGS